MEHRSLIWGLDDGWMGDGISSLGDNLSSDNVTCGRQDVNTLVCRIRIACISFCPCLSICICLCLWLVIRYSQVTCGGSKICSPWCTIGIARIPFITTWWAGGDPLPGCETLSVTSSHTNWLLSPPAPFSSSAWSSWSSSLWMWSLGKERMWRGFDCYQVWWALDTPVILLLIPSNSNLNWIYPTYASSW